MKIRVEGESEYEKKIDVPHNTLFHFAFCCSQIYLPRYLYRISLTQTLACSRTSRVCIQMRKNIEQTLFSNR